MKKLILCAFAGIMLVCTTPSQLSAMSDTTQVSVTELQIARVDDLNNRLMEIKSMDKTNLNRTEKKELRMEVRSIDKQLHEISGGVYVSVGAVVIILLLLIILL